MMWLVPLQGEAADLEEFPQRFPSGPVHAIVEADGRTYLTGPGFDQYSDAGDVRDRAAAALDQMAGVISLLWPAFRKPKLGSAVYQRDGKGGQGATVFVEGMEMRLKGHAPNVIVGGTAQLGATDAQRVHAKAQQSPHLTAAVAIWSVQPRGWAQLYRIVEEIKQHLKGPASKFGLCTDADLDRFKQSAQSHDAAGLGARHAIGYAPAPKHPMDLEEATIFVRELMLSALRL
jgi:hypothetical protein